MKHDQAIQDYDNKCSGLASKQEVSRDSLAAVKSNNTNRLSIEDKESKDLIEKLEREAIEMKRAAAMEQGKATNTEMELKRK